jgi:hypothetical protein
VLRKESEWRSRREKQEVSTEVTESYLRSQQLTKNHYPVYPKNLLVCDF